MIAAEKTGSAVAGRGDGDGGGWLVLAVLHALDLTIGVARGVQVDAELRQRRRSEHRNQASQHFQQHLHGPHNGRTRRCLQCGGIVKLRRQDGWNEAAFKTSSLGAGAWVRHANQSVMDA